MPSCQLGRLPFSGRGLHHRRELSGHQMQQELQEQSLQFLRLQEFGRWFRNDFGSSLFLCKCEPTGSF